MAKANNLKMPLKELLEPISRPESLVPDRVYKILGAHWYAKGLYIKDMRLGAEIRANRVYKIEEGDFVYNRLFAWKGSFAVATSADDSCYASNEFPSYHIRANRLDPRYLRWYFSMPSVWNEALGLSKGGTPTSRNRLKEENLLSMDIPLPSLPEQQRIVTRIESLSSRIEEARGLREQVLNELTAFLDSVANQLFESPELENYFTEIGNADLYINRESRNPSVSKPNDGFVYIDISSVKKGPSVLNSGQTIPGASAPSRARRVIHKDDIIISTVRPNLRAFAKIGGALDDQICSTGFAVITCGPSIDPNFLLYQFCSTFFVNQCMANTTGGHYPAINDANLKKIKIVVPPLLEQRRIATYLTDLHTKIANMQQVQKQTALELESMMPSILSKAFRGEL